MVHSTDTTIVFQTKTDEADAYVALGLVDGNLSSGWLKRRQNGNSGFQLTAKVRCFANQSHQLLD